MLGGENPVRWSAYWLLAIAVAATYMWFYIFSRDISLDEGYLMITVRDFVAGHALYDDIFAQYGPFYYFVRDLLFDGVGLTLSHDVVRILCMVSWGLAAALSAVTVMRETRSKPLGLLSFMLAVKLLSPLAHEPGHPQEIVAVIFALLLASLLHFRLNSIGCWLIGTAAAMLITIKINVGVFVLLAVSTYYLTLARTSGGIGWLKWVFINALCLAPFALMWRNLGEFWVFGYSLAVSAGLYLLALTFSKQQFEQPSSLFKEASIFATSMILFASVVLVAAIHAGSSSNGLFAGLVLTPLALSSVVTLPLEVSPWMLSSILLAISTAFYLSMRGSFLTLRLLVALKVGFGLIGVSMALVAPEWQIGLLGPWLWVVVLHSKKADEGLDRAPTITIRYLFALLSGWQLLQAYPIAGSQIAVATLGLVLAYIICLNDGYRYWLLKTSNAGEDQRLAGASRWFRGSRPMEVSGVKSVDHSVGSFFVIAAAFAIILLPLRGVVAEYRDAVPLTLPGTWLVKTAPVQAAWYQSLTLYLANNSDAFVTFPGVNSLYFWTGIDPPSHINVTEWGLLSEAEIQLIVDKLRVAESPKVVVIAPALAEWATLQKADRHALVRYVQDECEPLVQIGPFVVFGPTPKPGDGGPLAVGEEG